MQNQKKQSNSTPVDIRRGQTWECNEHRADASELPPIYDSTTHSHDRPRFFAVVEAVLDGVVELTVTRGNRNARTPVFGKTLDIHQDKLRDLERWSLKSQADSEHEVVTA